MSNELAKKDGISFVIPAYNEEKFIKKTIKSIIDAADELKINYEIVVSNNNSTDSTAEIAKELGARVVDQPERSIAKTRNKGAESAKYSILCFVDADSTITPKLLADGITKLVSGKKLVGSVVALTKYPTITSYGVWFYNFFSYIFRLGAGPFVLMHKSDFEKVGGFSEDIYNCEDIYFFRKVKNHFGRTEVAILNTSVYSSPRKFEKGRDSTGFLLELVKAMLNFAPSKQKNDFWYSAPHKIKSKKVYAIFIAAFFMATRGLFSNLSFSGQEYVYGGMTLFIFTLLSYAVLNKQNLKPFFAIFVLTFFIEVLGLNTGFPFGVYNYAPNYSVFGLLGVPFFVPLAWSIIVVSLAELTKKVYLTAIGALIFDILIENFAVKNIIWIWSSVEVGADKIFEAPVQNYISWIVISVVGFYIYKFLSNKDQRLAIESPIYKIAVLFLIFTHMLFDVL